MKRLLCILSLFCCLMTAFAKPSTQKLTIALDWLVNPNHAPLFVAQQQHYFQRFGLNVHFISPADPSDPPKWLAAGKVDLALDYQPHLIEEIARGLPLKQVGTLIATPLDCMAILKSSAIHSIADLKGKRIGDSLAGNSYIILKTMLNHVGLSLRDVTVINVHYDLTQALLAKRVDAIMGVDRNFEIKQMASLGHPVRVFYPEENGMPSFSGLVIVAKKGHENDPRIKRFLKALTLGVQYLINHPNKTWKTFKKNHPELNTSLNHAAWFATLPRFALRSAAHDPERYQTLATFLSS